MEIAAGGVPQEVQGDIPKMVLDTTDAVTRNAGFLCRLTDNLRLARLGGILMQFTDYTSDGSVHVPYQEISCLHHEVVSVSKKRGTPLDLPEQLDIALEYNNGDVINSLWQIFVTSRMYGRWLDSAIVSDLPNMSRSEKLQEMHSWRNAVAALKAYEPDRAQDPAGDTYYAWTHALAKVVFSVGTSGSRLAVPVFHHGTSIMHKVVHSFVKQSVKSDHTIAATYGNVIGQAIIDHIVPVDSAMTHRSTS